MSEFKRGRVKAKKIKADAVLCADLHIRADTPICRTDDFQEAMWKKLRYIFGICRDNNAPLLIAGDIGHRSQWPNWLLEKFISESKGITIVACLGQHDLPFHNKSEYLSSGCGVLMAADSIFFGGSNILIKGKQVCIAPVDFGEEECSTMNYKGNLANSDVGVMLAHRMVINSTPDWEWQVPTQAIQILKDNPQYKLIVTGDNHIPFVERYQGRVLVNPGSMMRSTAFQADYCPRVYLWDVETNEVEPEFLPFVEGVVNRFHIEIKENRDERMAKLIERIKVDYETGFSFEENIKRFFEINPTEKDVMDKVWMAIGE